MRNAGLAFAVLAALCFDTTANVAEAQSGLPLGALSGHTFAPAPGRNNYFSAETARVPGHVAGTAGVYLEYAHRPLVLENAVCRADAPSQCMTTGVTSNLLRFTATAYVSAALALWNRLQIGFVLPVTYAEGEPYIHPTMSVTIAPGFSRVAIADTRLVLKARLYGDSEGLGVGLAVFTTLPTAQWVNPGTFLGNSTAMVGGYLITEFIQKGFHVSANIGGFWRDKSTYLSTVTGPQITYSLGLAYDATPLVSILGELQGASSFSSQVDENTLEARLGGRITVEDFQFTLGGGFGLIRGVGVPVFRALGGVAWAPDRGDADNDGALDRNDACPTEMEDRDGYADDDGCPEVDNDDDGVADENDRCPSEAEDNDGFQDTDGCPDRDNDGDGVLDGYDACPAVPEDVDGDRDDDGCPDNDRDRDNIADDVDQCPDQAEDTDGFGDDDGCPETDFDNDGVSDDADQCADQAEDRDNYEDEDGCPEAGRAGPGGPNRQRQRDR